MQAIAFQDFTIEVMSLYRLTRAKKTAQRMAQVMKIASSITNLATTGDLTLETTAAFARIAEAGRHPNTTAALLSYFRRACHFAVSRGYLKSSPFAEWPGLVKWMPTEGSRVHTPRVVGKVLASLAARAGESYEAGRLHAWACLLAHTGLRRDEALNLHERDLDLETETVEVKRRLKRPTARRTVPLTTELAAVLGEWMPRRTCPSGWIFPGVKSGKPWRGGIAGKRPTERLRQAGESVGVKDFTPGSLRHSFATSCATIWHVSPAALQGWMGHTSIKTTMKYYVHLEIAHLKAAAKLIAFPAA